MAGVACHRGLVTSYSSAHAELSRLDRAPLTFPDHLRGVIVSVRAFDLCVGTSVDGLVLTGVVSVKARIIEVVCVIWFSFHLVSPLIIIFNWFIALVPREDVCPELANLCVSAIRAGTAQR
jgi:hypothetical protein